MDDGKERALLRCREVGIEGVFDKGVPVFRLESGAARLSLPAGWSHFWSHTKTQRGQFAQRRGAALFVSSCEIIFAPPSVKGGS